MTPTIVIQENGPEIYEFDYRTLKPDRYELLPQDAAAELERLKAERVGKRLIDEEDIPTIWLATSTMQNERERNFVECTLGVVGLGRKVGTE